jgi:UDP-glucose 4-epimerase
VTIVDALIASHGGDLRNVASAEGRLRINIADLRDADALRSSVRGQDVIFHLAGQVSHGDSMRDPELDLGVNCISTINLVEACRTQNPKARLVHTSTRQVYGRPLRLPVDEDHPTVPVDVNGINKLAAEYYHLLYHHTYDVRSVVLRPDQLLRAAPADQERPTGRRGHADSQAILGQKVQIWATACSGATSTTRTTSSRRCSPRRRPTACYGRVFNLGADEHWSLNEFSAFLARPAAFEVERMPVPGGPDADRHRRLLRRLVAVPRRDRLAPEGRPGAGAGETVAFFRAHAEVYL